MPENPGQYGGSLGYVASLTTTTSRVATVQGVSSMASAQKGTIAFYQALVTDNVFFQSDSFDIGGTFTPDDRTTVEVTKGGQSTYYVNQVNTGETFQNVIDNLIARIGLDSDIAAEAVVDGSQATVTLSSATGENYTLAVTSSGDMTTSAVASIGTGSGASAVKMRKLVSVDVEYSLSPDGNPQTKDTHYFWDGAETSALTQSLPLSAQRHPSSIGDIQNANGG